MLNCFLGVDIGTTQIKAAIVDEHGGIMDMVNEGNHVYRPHDGWSELDMEEIWQKLCVLTQTLAARNPAAIHQLAGVGITAVGEGLWPLDSEMRPVRRAILWNDTRARNLNISNREAIDGLLVKNSVTPLCSGSPPVILRWLKEHEPEHYRRTAYGVHCGDWLNYRLTGRLATDQTLASTSTINVKTQEYFFELFELLGIGEKAGTMPEIMQTTDIVGCITGEAARATGLRYGIPVIAGALDAAATAFGAGAHKQGDACTVFGTSLCNVALLGEEQVDHSNPCGSTLCGIAPGTFLRMMSTGCGSAAIDWAKRAFAPDLYFDELERQISLTPMGSNGLIFHPYLSGERAPFKDPFASGGFYGLTTSHTRMDMMRAAYEGLILSLKDCYGEIPKGYTRAFAAGGGAGSDLLCSLMASAIGVPVHRPSEKQLGIVGITAAIRYGLGYTKVLEPQLTDGGSFYPNEREAQQLEQLYTQYVSLRNSVQEDWHTSKPTL